MITAVKEAFPRVRDKDCSAETILFSLQLEQFEHDEKYHREIARLTTHHRLNHMALHFAKYTGQLAEVGADERQIKRLVIDIFIIALSCSNTLNIRVWDQLRPPDCTTVVDLVDLGAQIRSIVDAPPVDVEALFRWTAITTSPMAAACEKLDHIEDFPFRKVMRESVIKLVKGALVFASVRGWDLAQLVRERLRGVKEKSILHGHL